LHSCYELYVVPQVAVGEAQAQVQSASDAVVTSLKLNIAELSAKLAACLKGRTVAEVCAQHTLEPLKPPGEVGFKRGVQSHATTFVEMTGALPHNFFPSESLPF
jgi:hypothetical protein